MNTHLLKQASVLAIDEQIELAQAIWNGIVAKAAVPAVTPAQKAELDSRLADHLANPTEVISWDEVKAKALANIGR
jgi:putative addiction module component (TIGR02574 family)